MMPTEPFLLDKPAGVETNPMIVMNSNVSYVGDKASSWGTPCLPSKAMPLNQSVSEILSTSPSNVASSNVSKGVEMNSTTVTNSTATKVGGKVSS